MSKRVQYPDGFVGFASGKAAAVLAKKPDHKIIDDKVDPPKSPDPSKAAK